MGRKRNRRGKRNELLRLHYTKERWSGETYSRKNEKSDGGDEADLEHRRKDTRIVADDYERKIKMFNVSGKHGSIRGSDEGWGNEERMEKIKRKYIKWILKLDRRTPNYILEKETKMKELRMEAIKRAVKYEQKARQSEKIIVECIKEIEKRRENIEESKWEKKRRRILEEVDIGRTEKKREEEETRISEKIIERIEE